MSQPRAVPLQFEGSFRIPHVDRDASGLTLHRETGHLWVVIDEPERLVEFTDAGEFVSAVELKGFKDTEGLCHLGGDRFAIAEEGKMRITLVEIPRGITKIDNDGHPEIPAKPYDGVVVYPNAAKDVETISYPYAELFRDFAAAVCRPNAVLVTFGYGFGDDHINRVILDALTIPSTHVVIISFDDPGNRVSRFCQRVGSDAQLTILLGPHFGDLKSLVGYYLPKAALDSARARKTTLLQRRGETPVPSTTSTDGESATGSPLSARMDNACPA